MAVNYSQAVASLPSDDGEVQARASDPRSAARPGVDLREGQARLAAAASPRPAGVSTSSYLKANRVEAGTASYAYVVQLVSVRDQPDCFDARSGVAGRISKTRGSPA